MHEYESFLFRSAEPRDLNDIYAFSKVAGLTNLPPDKDWLKNNIDRSIHCFSTDIKTPTQNDFYFFVLENIQTKKLVGCCGIYADIGTRFPFYAFFYDTNKDTITRTSELKDASELVSLYLAPHQRTHHLGGILSRGRYLWIANNPKRFHEKMIAEMRGRTDHNNKSPFWENFVHQSFVKDKEFEEADLEILKHHTDFIEKFIPATPIPMSSMDERAKACIGIPHRNTRGALNLLLHEGFKKIPYVNVIDGGPILSANMHEVHTIQDSRILTFAGTRDIASHDFYLISTTTLPFYLMVSHAYIDEANHCCFLSKEIAQTLHLKVDDKLRLAHF